MKNRIIKFRAWDKKDKIMYYDIQKGIKFTDLSHYNFDEFLGNPNGMRDYHEWEVMQYTGLLDKSGKEIYEGDIVKVPDSYDYNSSPSTTYVNEEVFWSEDRLCWFLVFGGYFEMELYRVKDIEVIGNFYENASILDNK